MGRRSGGSDHPYSTQGKSTTTACGPCSTLMPASCSSALTSPAHTALTTSLTGWVQRVGGRQAQPHSRATLLHPYP